MSTVAGILATDYHVQDVTYEIMDVRDSTVKEPFGFFCLDFEPIKIYGFLCKANVLRVFSA